MSNIWTREKEMTTAHNRTHRENVRICNNIKIWKKRVAFTILWFNSSDVIQFGQSNNLFARCAFGYRHSFRKYSI